MNKERSEKYNEAILERMYMFDMLSKIKNYITNEEYEKMKSEINEDFYKKKAKYGAFNYDELIVHKNKLECV